MSDAATAAEKAPFAGRVFRTGIEVRLTDLDLNGHVNHGAYLAYAEAARVHQLEERGLGPKQLVRAGIAVVILRLEVDYRRELSFEDTVTATSEYEFSGQGKSFRNLSRVFKQDEVAAELKAVLGILDLQTRRLRPDPEGLMLGLATQ